MTIFDPPEPDSCFMRDSNYECQSCEYVFVIPELYPGEAKEAGDIEDCSRCGAESSEVCRV